MKKIKVFFIETYDDGTVGGSHSTLYNLVTHLDADRFDITVGFLSENIYTSRLREKGIKVEILNSFYPSKLKIKYLRKIINWYKLVYQKSSYLSNFFLKSQFDLIVLNNTLYTSEAYIIAAKKAAIPVAVYERGMAPFSARDLRNSKYVSVSMPVSKAVYDSMLLKKVKSKKIIQVYDGIDDRKIIGTKSREEVFKELNIPENCLVIGMVGNIKEWKGQEYFIKAAIHLSAKFPDLYSIIVGACAEEDRGYKNKLDQMVKSSGFADRIIFTGYRTDVPNILSILDVFVHASIEPEPFGMVIIEAMAAKIPVVATNFGGPLESLNNGECGILVPPSDSQAIADASQKYLMDIPFRKAIVEKAYSRYTEFFTLSKSVEKQSKILSGIVS